ncbi:hypothetical protein E1B28_004625 [Marasmius oreades]|uniref:Uncharacterized protein n=1 Tax=Marasmius oreades TaxID=181124 RepID=A0A9P8AD63_9AGAR|nr:uncharacterized protein E1B28_004625 [Marasmius oreades]KAG7097259.1 hypothetical protein E1B28_004625 [Marasmius oreades]
MYRSPSPYAPPPEALYNTSPYSAAAPASPYTTSASSSPQSAQISPGSITYTTSTTADGKIIYHPFKAVPASYQTPSGVVSGIQWVPAEATQILPAGAQPASTDFAEAWNRGNLSKEDKNALKEWQRAEDKRRRKEEKQSTKVLREKGLGQTRFDDDALRYAREQDAVTRERRKSFNQGVAFPGAPAPAGNIYTPPSPYQGYAAPPAATGSGYTRERKYSTGGSILSDLDNSFNNMGIVDRDQISGPGIGRPRKYSNIQVESGAGARPLSAYGTTGAHSPNIGSTYAPPPRPLSRNSGYGGGHSPIPGTTSLPYAPPRPHSRNASVSGAYPPYTNPSPGLRSAEPAGGVFLPHGPRPSSPYANANYPPTAAHGSDPYARGSSPFASPAALPTDVYPPGHILEGQPIPRSRATTPIPGMAPTGYQPGGAYHQSVGGRPVSPHPAPAAPTTITNAPPQQLAAPECFSRPINGAHPYTPFETMKIQDMNDFYESVPRMPAVLQPHDVYPEDWSRLMGDLALAWAGRLPVPTAPGSQPPKRATVTGSLVDLWNHSFLNRRGVELVLYKGRERRSGPNAGVIDLHLLVHDDADLSDTESSDDDDDDDDDEELRYNAAYGTYAGRPGYAPDMAEIRQKRLAAKAERKRRRKEKKSRQRAREREKKYTLYLACVPQRSVGHPGAMPTPTVPNYTQGGSTGYGAYGGGF